ncbi:NAD-dependent epimerase/dehydratase family protein [Paenibacillus lignilyticus]|uniref:NAD(P)-dependent oxidoreductase n=1 Tax=Paenibacillus lignilyticus TaxID=1172615 RepID=A0ABS5CIM0_9BACL|nr:NAD(P)-dependent oxidoreductase [Paenibacillus lignilyticus]MBP3965662.1 NAD(P)-dependent oxidoreductase [Paenibacillus lignilyticus]
MKTIAVTGASGKLGVWVVNELLAQGYSVIALDNKKSDKLRCRQITVDLSNLGQVIGGINGAEAIVHLAAIPSPGQFSNEFTFSNNVLSTYNVFEAASVLGIQKVVFGSSESSYGFCWAPKKFDPHYVPVDEAHPQLPQECYGLSKVVNEQTGETFNRRTGMQVAAMRYSLIATPDELKSFTARIDQPLNYKHILWSYVDIRDAVSATIAALKTDGYGAVSLNITSSDTLSDWDTERLLNEFYPEVRDRRRSFEGREALVSNEAACRLLNWKPIYSWKDSQ